ncbi:MAG: hypothetical protein KA604_02835 [Candidatus Saccharimonas sp.]|nr:hypothetical protein [Candidatus Saccharimonas sp.]
MSVYSSTVSALTEMSVKGIATIDDCILDNATNPVAKSIYENLMNFAKGTGVWIVLAMIALGTIIFLATGREVRLKNALIGVGLLVFLGAIVSIVSSAIGGNNC